MERKVTHFIAFIALVVGIFAAAAVAADSPPEVGSSFPDIRLPVPAAEEHRRYLGLPDTVEFAIPQIKANLVIVEVLNMY